MTSDSVAAQHERAHHASLRKEHAVAAVTAIFDDDERKPRRHGAAAIKGVRAEGGPTSPSKTGPLRNPLMGLNSPRSPEQTATDR
jgi:hypothetical protein